MDYGRITITHTVWCGYCDRFDYVEQYRDPRKWAREQGWKFTHDKGWICPDCAAKLEVLRRAENGL
jgi:hypothetical protein